MRVGLRWTVCSRIEVTLASRLYVANFTGDGASRFNDRNFAVGKRTNVSGQCEELLDRLFGGFRHDDSADA